jgi:hypothetical protein
MANGETDRVNQGASRCTMYTLNDLAGGLSDYFLLVPSAGAAAFDAY